MSDDRPAIFTADFGPTEARIARYYEGEPTHERNVLVWLAALVALLVHE